MTIPLSLLCNNWFVAALSKDLRQKPLSRKILGLPLVLFRSGEDVAVLLDRCPHRNVPLSYGIVEGGSVRCSYHGWRFDARGICREIPGLAQPRRAEPELAEPGLLEPGLPASEAESELADSGLDESGLAASVAESSPARAEPGLRTSGLVKSVLAQSRQSAELLGVAEDDHQGCPARNATPFLAKELDGLIWVWVPETAFQSAGTLLSPHALYQTSQAVQNRPALNLPKVRYPALRQSAFHSFLWTASANSHFVDGLENLLDATHPAFVHSLLVRTNRRQQIGVQVRRNEEQVEAIYSENSRPEALIPRIFEGVRTESIGRYFPPTTAQLEYRGKNGPRFILTAMFTPVDEKTCKIYAFVSTPRGLCPGFLKEMILKLVFGVVLKQDLRILHRQSENIERFGAPRFVSTPVDVMRPHILYFLQRNTAATTPPFEKALSLEL